MGQEKAVRGNGYEQSIIIYYEHKILYENLIVKPIQLLK